MRATSREMVSAKCEVAKLEQVKFMVVSGAQGSSDDTADMHLLWRLLNQGDTWRSQ